MGGIVIGTLLALVVGLVLFVAGMKVHAVRQTGADPLNKEQRDEYGRLLLMRENIQLQAPEHIALGDSFARIALDEAAQTYPRRSKEL